MPKIPLFLPPGIGPALFLFHLHRIGRGARHAYEHVLAQVKGSVVPLAERDRPDREIFPLRKLGGHQAAHECGVYY